MCHNLALYYFIFKNQNHYSGIRGQRVKTHTYITSTFLDYVDSSSLAIAHEVPTISVPSTTQSKEVDAELVRHYGAVTELLRHFWACFPTRTPQLEQKVYTPTTAS